MARHMSEVRPETPVPEIRFDMPGCYRSPAFQRLLDRHSELLQLYARHVEAQACSAAYVQRVRQVVPRLTRWLGAELAADGRPGRCVQASAVLSRLLEELGVWNYIVAGGCVISFVPADVRPCVFYLFDLKPVEIPHAWVVAPPFDVIDLTLRQQRYPGTVGQRIPAMVLCCRAPRVAVDPEDVCTPALLQGLLLRGWSRNELLQRVFPQFWQFLQQFPARRVAAPGVCLKYIPARVLLPPAQEVWETMPLINGKSFRQLKLQIAAVLAGADAT